MIQWTAPSTLNLTSIQASSTWSQGSHGWMNQRLVVEILVVFVLWEWTIGCHLGLRGVNSHMDREHFRKDSRKFRDTSKHLGIKEAVGTYELCRISVTNLR